MLKFIIQDLIIIFSIYYLILIIDFVRFKNITNITDNNSMYRYLELTSIKDIETLTKKGLIYNGNKFYTYVSLPLMLCFPVIGHLVLLSIACDEIMVFKNSTTKYINEQCENYFYKDLNNCSSDINKKLNIIQKYSSENDIHLIRKFLINKQNIYYQLGFESFIKLLDIIIEKDNQISYMSNSIGLETRQGLKDLVNNYLSFIEALNSKNINDDNKIKDYSDFLLSMTNDIKNKKY